MGRGGDNEDDVMDNRLRGGGGEGGEGMVWSTGTECWDTASDGWPCVEQESTAAVSTE